METPLAVILPTPTFAFHGNPDGLACEGGGLGLPVWCGLMNQGAVLWYMGATLRT